MHTSREVQVCLMIIFIQGDKDPKTGKIEKTKPSKHTKKFKAMYGEEIRSHIR